MSGTDQRSYWTEEAGPVWIAEQAAMDTLLRPVLDLVMAEAAIPAGARVLDVGCGTGQSTHAAAQAAGPEGRVTGVDISDPMLAHAALRLQDVPGATLLHADVQRERFDKGSFDRIISRFGVMFFDDVEGAFAGLWDALAPGGTMTLAAWGPAPDNPYFMLPARAARATLGPVPEVDRTLPGPFMFEDPGRILPRLAAAGIAQAQVETHDLALTPEGTPEDVASLCCRIGPAASAIRHHEAGPQARAALQTAIAAQLAPLSGPEGLRIAARVHLYKARKSP